MATKYTFETTSTYEYNDNKRRNNHHHHTNSVGYGSHRRQASHGSSSGDHDPLENGSLTYSAASSINSTGESTDSSFADIMKVLDVQDSRELASYLRKEKGRHCSEKSIAESLAYSTDADTYLRSLATDNRSLATDNESRLHGADILSTFTGQASDQKYDGGGYYSSAGASREDPESGLMDDILFSPAEHTDSLKKRKERKRRERMEKLMALNGTSNAHQSSHESHQQQQQQQQQYQQNHQQQQNQNAPNIQRTRSSSSNTSIKKQQSNGLDSNGNQKSPLKHAIKIESRKGSTPTLRPPKSNIDMTEEEDVWYAKWWMLCFPDALKNLTETR